MDQIQPKEIFKGFVNLLFKDEKIECIAEEKLKRCFDCPLREAGFCTTQKQAEVVKDFNYNGTERKKGQLVKGCGCSLKLKVRSTSICPLGKF